MNELTIKAWVARNRGSLDVGDMSFFKTKKEAMKVFKDSQEYVRVVIKFLDKGG